MKKPLIRLIKDCKKQWGWMFAFVVLYFLAGFFKSQIALLIGKMADTTLFDGLDKAISYILPLLLLLFLEWVRGIITYNVSAQTSERMFFDIKLRMFDKLSRIKVNSIENTLRSGDMVVRINNDLNSICDTIAGSYTWFMRVIFTAAIAFVSCVMISWQLSLVYFTLMPPIFWLMQKISKPLGEKQKAILKNQGKGMNIANELLGAQEVIKSFNLEQEMNCRFANIVEKSALIEIESEKINAKMIAVKYIGMILPMISMLFFGIILVSHGIVTPGSVIAFSAMCGQVRGLLEISSNIIYTNRNATAAANRIYEILDMETEVEHSNDEIEQNTSDEIICAEGLSFAYNERSKVLDGFSVKIKSGEKVAFVGKSGCGKSTFIKILCKFYDEIKSDNFTIFGQPIENWSNSVLRSKISLISQETFLLNDTIYNNVLVGNKDAKEQDVIHAIKLANLWDFVSSLSQKAQTFVGDGGVKLSGGQKQRIAIARAFLKDAPLVLLDEPTAALDKETEREVQKALEILLESRTAIVIAHRLYTLKNMDTIYFLDDGKVVEQGTYDELCSMNGKFNSLLKGVI